MNSFRSVERAIEFEIERQAAPSTPARPLLQETRGWSDERGETYRMRVKETSDDYRYFPEPDLPPLHLDAAWLAEVRADLPELPARSPRSLSGRPRADRLRRRGARRRPGRDGPVRGDPRGRPGRSSAKPVANWVTGEYLRLRNATDGPVVVAAPEFAAIVVAATSGAISRAQAREVLEAHADDRRERGLDHRRAGLPPDLGHAAS